MVNISVKPNMYEKSIILVSEFWLGLRSMSTLTSWGTWELMVELEDFKNNSYIALYHRFKVGNSPLYRLSISGYDSLASSLTDSLTRYHNGQAFTTSDRDNDLVPSYNCAVEHRGAWWYEKCHSSSLNALCHKSNRSYVIKAEKKKN